MVIVPPPPPPAAARLGYYGPAENLWAELRRADKHDTAHDDNWQQLVAGVLRDKRMITQPLKPLRGERLRLRASYLLQHIPANRVLVLPPTYIIHVIGPELGERLDWFVLARLRVLAAKSASVELFCP